MNRASVSFTLFKTPATKKQTPCQRELAYANHTLTEKVELREKVYVKYSDT